MTQTFAGPPLSPDEESGLRRSQLVTALAETEQSARVIEQKIAGMQQVLNDRRTEIAQMRAELED